MFFPALVAIAVLGGVGAGLIVDLGRRMVERVASRAAGGHLYGGTVGAAAAGAVLLVGAAPELRDHVEAADAETREAIERSRLHDELELAVDTIGADYITRFGPATTNRSYQTHLAWELSLPISDVHGTGGRGIVLSAPAQPIAGVVRVYRRARRRVTLARVGSWTVSTRPPSARHVFTWPIVGFSLRVAAARYGQPGATAG